jgi:hypothetical protein
MFGLQQVDQQIGQAISMCWMMLPKDKKNPDAVAAEMRRIVERALANLKEDAKAFGIADDQENADAAGRRKMDVHCWELMSQDEPLPRRPSGS